MTAETARIAQRPALMPDRPYSYSTNFYPLYDGANDQVDRVLPVRAVRFQRVVPKYRLSTSETRDEGLGPAVDYIPAGRSNRGWRREAIASTERSEGTSSFPRTAAEDRSLTSSSLTQAPPGRLASWQGRTIDVFA